ncbi:MAG: flavodoxin family protein [Actinomycetia bacterium]|nr:flavodoxin family protein [Actinomycetes bacterium]
MAKIIGISASPRKGMSTEYYIKILLSEIKKESSKKIDTEQINLSSAVVKPCIACDYCKTHFDCSQDDTFKKEFIDKLKDDDLKGIVFGSPVYMGGITALGKAFLDRTVLFRRNNFHFKNMVGGAFSIGNSRNGGQELTLSNIHHAFLIHDMIIVGDGFSTSHFGGSAWFGNPAGFKDDPDGTSTTLHLAKRMVEMFKLLKYI